MNFILRSLAILLASSLYGACADSNSASQTKSMVGGIDLKLMTRAEQSDLPLASAIGSLSEVAINEESPEFSDLYSLCTGIRISSRLVITAKHCSSDSFVFDTNNLARDEDVGQVKFKTFGKLVRLMFMGELVEESKAALAFVPEAKALYQSESLDFAIWSFKDLPTAGFLDLRYHTKHYENLALYGHPNGSPLSLAQNCRGRPHPKDAGMILHDCDSLNGSSGGLLWDMSSGLPVGLHTTGSGSNNGDYYKQHGSFEAIEQLAQICKSPECQGAEGFNQAIGIEAIIQDLLKHSPELSAELKLTESQQSCDH